MRLHRLVVPALAAVVGVTLTTGPVRAEPDHPTRVSVTDGRHDVRRIVEREGRQDSKPRVDRRRRAGDLTTVRILHRASDVTVRMRMRRLGRLQIGPLVMFRTPVARLTAFYIPGVMPGTSVAVFDQRNGNDIDCPDATAVIRRARGAVELNIPRTCLGDPTWVRSRAISFLFEEHGRREVEYVDIAPGTRLKLKGNLSTRAWAPPGAVIPNVVPPPAAARSLPQPALDALSRLGLAG